MQKSYKFSADAIRAIAIIFVVVVHVTAEYLLKVTNFSSVNWFIAVTLETLTKTAVPLFVMLSGELLLDPQKKETVKAFYQKRLAKIGFPILFWPLFYYFGFLYFKHLPFSFMNFLNSYVFLNTYFHLYFLFTILGLYLFTPFFRILVAQLKEGDRRYLVILTLLLAALAEPFVYALPTKLNYWSIFTVFVPFIGYYLAGSELSRINWQKKTKPLLVAIVILVITTVAAKYSAYSWANVALKQYLVDALSIGEILLSISCFILLKQSVESAYHTLHPMIIKGVQTVSQTSFGIYIIHPIFLFLFGNVFSSFSSVFLFIPLKVCSVFFVSLVFVFISQKIRIGKYFFGN